MVVSKRNGLGLSFKNLKFGAFVSKRSLRTDSVRMIEEVLAGSLNKNISRNKVLALLEQELENLDDVWEVVRGHDAVAVLKIGLSSAFGAYNTTGLTTDMVGGALRLAFSFEDLANTKMYTDSKRWSEKTGCPLWETH